MSEARSGKVLAADPENAEEWKLLAEFEGWDSKLRVLDADSAMAAVKRALNAVSSSERHRAATEIYQVRKRQIALMIEPDLMMPSYASARHLHETMLLWLRLLEEVPWLNSSLIEEEIALCEDVCARSRISLAPGDRLIYAAFSSFNRKESYGELFRRTLGARVEKERKREGELKAAALEHVERHRIAYRVWMECEHPSLESERARLEGDMLLLEADLRMLSSLGSDYFQQRIDELDQQLAKLKGVNLTKKHRIRIQIGLLKGKIIQIEDELGPLLELLRESIATIRTRIAEIDHDVMDW